MGPALWLASGMTAWITARIVPLGRTRGWAGELAVSAAAAVLLGILATALDFGGWREADWRAALFAFFGAFGGIGVLRMIRS